MNRLNLFLFLLTSLLALPALATVPATMLVEGTLANIAGAPIADGTYSLTFAIYADGVATTPVWTEGPLTVPVKSGGFSQFLGTQKALSASLLALTTTPMLAIAVGGDPELPRKPIAAVPYAMRASVAENVECTGCISAGALAPAVMDLINSTANLATVATSGKYSDLKNLPTLVATAQACGQGQVVSGVDATGKIVCVTGASLSSDPLGFVSNGALSNITPVNYLGATNLKIPDNDSTIGANDSINITDTGLVGSMRVALTISNSDLMKLTVNLIAPDNSKIVLWDKTSSGSYFDVIFPDTQAVVSGSLGAWNGKSLKGLWKLQVLDLGAQIGGGTYDGSVVKWSISAITPASNKVEVKGSLTVDGTLTVNGDNNILPPGMISAFNTATCPVGWIPANGNNGTPDLRGRFPLGVGNLPDGNTAIALAAKGGNNRWRISGASGSVSTGPGSGYAYFMNSITLDFGNSNIQTASTGSSNTGGAYFDIVPPYAGVYYCVKQ